MHMKSVAILGPMTAAAASAWVVFGEHNLGSVTLYLLAVVALAANLVVLFVSLSRRNSNSNKS